MLSFRERNFEEKVFKFVLNKTHLTKVFLFLLTVKILGVGYRRYFFKWINLKSRRSCSCIFDFQHR